MLEPLLSVFMDGRSRFLSTFPSRRDLRWTSGLVLMAYAALHLANHALGLVSLGIAETVLGGFRSFWHSAPGTILLYGAAITHVTLAAIALWERRSLRMPFIEALRLVLGFSLPLLLVSHLTAMRWAYEVFGIDGSYARVVGGLWNPAGASFQLSMLVAVWLHGCLGLHLALRARAGYRRTFYLWFALAVLLPVLAALGFLSMGRELQWIGLRPESARSLSLAQATAIDAARDRFAWIYGVALLVLLAARQLHHGLVARRAGRTWITLRYPDREIRVPRGWTVLEASRAHGIAHMSSCGGRARCSTCRIRVSGPVEHIGDAGREELHTLARVNAPSDVRLACQLRPQGDLTVTPLFAAPTGIRRGLPASHSRSERDVAILFVDLRRWSGLSERQWPADLTYVLDHYFAIVGEAVRESGGLPNQFIGDSVMAIFGLDVDLPTACRQALGATELIGRRLDDWRIGFESQFGNRLDFGMGLHAGRAAVGEVGYMDTTTFTAVGEVVNTASRLQDHSKHAAARLVVSLFAAEQAGAAQALGVAEVISVRGRSEPLEVLCVPVIGSYDATGTQLA